MHCISVRVFDVRLVDYYIAKCSYYAIIFQTRYCSVEDAEKVRKEADSFLEKSLHSDVCLVFAPSQVRNRAVSGAGTQ